MLGVSHPIQHPAMRASADDVVTALKFRPPDMVMLSFCVVYALYVLRGPRRDSLTLFVCCLLLTETFWVYTFCKL